MVTKCDKAAATVVVVPQILGTVELVCYTGTSLWSVAKISLQKLAELYHSHLSKNVEKKIDIQIKIAAEIKVLNGRVYAIFMAIITIIPVAGIYRYKLAKNEDTAKKLDSEGLEFAKGKNYEKAFEKYKEASQLGSSEAKYSIYYDAEEYIKANLITSEEVSKLIHQAASDGHAPAQFALAGHYFGEVTEDNDNLKLKEDREKGLKLLRKAALQQYPCAMSDLGAEIEENEGSVSANYWFKKAMDKGDFSGKANWGINLREGKGVVANPEEGFRLIKEAANNGSSIARKYIYNLSKPQSM